MFKDEYKGFQEKIHPDKDLIERTKKLALEKYRQQENIRANQDTPSKAFEKDNLQQEGEASFKTLPWSEEKTLEEDLELDEATTLYHKPRRISFATGLAASVIIICVGAYFIGTLRKQPNVMQKQEKCTATPAYTIEEQEDNISQKEQDNKKEDTKGQKKDKNNNGKATKEKDAGTSALQEKINKMAAMTQDASRVKLDYGAGNRVILHGNFGIIVYDLGTKQIIAAIEKEEYFSMDNWELENVSISSTGQEICWFNTASQEAKVYSIETDTQQTVSVLEQEGKERYQGIHNATGSEKQIYKEDCSSQGFAYLDSNRTCQLIYQIPAWNSQASLSIAIVDWTSKEERIYPVFGQIAETKMQNSGYIKGDYYNEAGEQMFHHATPTATAIPTPNTEINPEQDPTKPNDTNSNSTEKTENGNGNEAGNEEKKENEKNEVIRTEAPQTEE